MLPTPGSAFKVFCICFAGMLLLAECTEGGSDSKGAGSMVRDSSSKIIIYTPGSAINTGNTTPAQLIAFARTLTGTPYLYASSDPDKGFDCSGFITYVFNHFGIAVPRSSVGFTNVGTEVKAADARPGDLVLFTGTDSTIRVVGHMGIVVSALNGDVKFIHSTSGRANGVTETGVKPNYLSRLVKIIRIFP